jgi:gamma-glutamyl hercynylcysteine S-oxide hydrolase
MCRHLAWLGEPRTVASLVLEPPHGLLTQSYAPRRQSHGLMNADGWGVGLHHPETAPGSPPVRWRSSRPLWGDPSFHSVAPVLWAGSVLAAVRSATPGMPADETAAAPFTDGTWLVSHNGRVDRSVLPATAAAAAESTCDSAVLTAHVLEQGVDRLARTVTTVAAADPGARLSLLLTDGTRVLAVTWGDPLSYLRTAAGVVVASEPYDDDPGWVDVADRHLLVATRDGVEVAPIGTRERVAS